MSSSPPPESGLESEAEASPESGHGKEAEASPESVQRKEAEEVITKLVKPEAAAAEREGNGAYINIKITSQTAPDVLVRVKRDVAMELVMDKYCAKHSLHPKAVVFLDEEGKHIRASQTAEEAGLDDGHSISVNMAQLGGSGRA